MKPAELTADPVEDVTSLAPASLPESIPLISVIVVNYNGMEVLPKCLAALDRLNYPNCEIIIIDNGSRDGSAEFAEMFEGKFPVHVLRYPANRGLAVARNAGVKLAKGQYLAFIDNDGFAQPDWLSAARKEFTRNPRVGVVAALVLFNQRPDIINGLGGGMTEQGVGFDHLYHRPLGFHDTPEEISYAMGCGMILSREAAAVVFPIDELLVNYYDDVEIGIRAWRSGFIVKPCPESKVVHSFNHSSLSANPIGKEVLCHRNRLRTALKYWPLTRLPGFLATEISNLTDFIWNKKTGLGSILFWNLRHLGSALSIRRRFHDAKGKSPIPLPRARGPRLYPRNTDFAPDWKRIGPVIDMERSSHLSSLNFGWYYLESIHQTPIRYTADIASAFLRTTEETNVFLLRFIAYLEEPFVVELTDRDGRVLYHWQFAGEIFKLHSVLEPIFLPPGEYQVLLKCSSSRPTQCGRWLGVGVNFVCLWRLA